MKRQTTGHFRSRPGYVLSHIGALLLATGWLSLSYAMAKTQLVESPLTEEPGQWEADRDRRENENADPQDSAEANDAWAENWGASQGQSDAAAWD